MKTHNYYCCDCPFVARGNSAWEAELEFKAHVVQDHGQARLDEMYVDNPFKINLLFPNPIKIGLWGYEE